MAVDIYRDFAYARSIAIVGEADLTVPVDDVSRIPPNDLLAKGDFHLTFESSFGEGAFEVIKVVSVAGNVLTVERGVGGAAFAHPAYTVLKGAFTAAMARRTRAILSFPTLPIFDVELYNDGDIAWDIAASRPFMALGGVWVDFFETVQGQLDSLQSLVSILAAKTSELDTGADLEIVVGRVSAAVAELQEKVVSLDQSGLLMELVTSIEDIENARIVEAAERAAAMDPVTAAIALGG